MADVLLESRSAAERFALHLRAKPGEYDRHAVGALLGMAPGAVDKALQPGVDLAVITIAHHEDMGRVWRAGPRLAEWRLSASPAAQASAKAVAEVLSAPKPKRGGRRMYLPLLDPKKLVVATDRPLPTPVISRRGVSRHDHLFDGLPRDGMSVIGIPIAYQASLLKAAQTYLEARPELKKVSAFYIRRVTHDVDGVLVTSDEEIGIWRVARDGVDAQPRSRKLAAVG